MTHNVDVLQLSYGPEDMKDYLIIGNVLNRRTRNKINVIIHKFNQYNTIV